jgi:hypothetical protein
VRIRVVLSILVASRGHVQIDGQPVRLLHHRRLRADPGAVTASATAMQPRLRGPGDGWDVLV